MQQLIELFNTAVGHCHEGRVPEAESLCRTLLKRFSNPHPEVQHLLGAVLSRQGQYAEAIEWLGLAVSRRPKQAVYHFDLAGALRAVGYWSEAVSAYRTAVRLRLLMEAAYRAMWHRYLGGLASAPTPPERR